MPCDFDTGTGCCVAHRQALATVSRRRGPGFLVCKVQSTKAPKHKQGASGTVFASSGACGGRAPAESVKLQERCSNQLKPVRLSSSSSSS